MQGILVILVAAHEAVQDVVAVGRHYQLADRQPHVARQVAGEDVAEVAGGHREGHGAQRPAQLQGGMEVVDDLGHDPRPVDRVDRHQPGALEEALVGEAGLDHFLAVVKLPSMAMLWMLSPRMVVICRRCTSDTRLCGCRMKMSAFSQRRQPSMAAEPVSPEVAPMITTRSPRLVRTWSSRRPSSCRAKSLKASVGPWNSSITHSLVSS